MHLDKIILDNFRCFKHLEVNLHPRLNVFVAENGGGKTAILEAIAYAISPFVRSLSTANQRLSAPALKDTDVKLVHSLASNHRTLTFRSDYTQIQIKTTNGLEWDVYKATSHFTKSIPRLSRSTYMSYAEDVLGSINGNERKLLPVFAYYPASRGSLAVPQRIRDSKINYDYPTSALLNCLQPNVDMKELLKWFSLSEATELRRNKGFSPEDYDEYFALRAVRLAVESLLNHKYIEPRFNDHHKFVVTSKKNGGEYELCQLSQGYLSMLALSMDFARRMALANEHLSNLHSSHSIWSPISEYIGKWNPEVANEPLNMRDHIKKMPFIRRQGPLWAPAVMLIDEIDVHLHPSWQQRVLADLMRTFPCTQFIVTTHSPQVLSTVRKENIRVLTRFDDDQWIAKEPHQNPLAHSNSLSLESIMGGTAYPPGPLTDKLREYQRLVGDGHESLSRALELRGELEREWGSDDNELQLLDVTIRKNETLRKLCLSQGEKA
jgi:predicted ATP-binding protein involved in virulence